MWDSIRDWAIREIGEVRRAPVAFALAVGLGALVGYSANEWFHSERFAIMEARLEGLKERPANASPALVATPEKTDAYPTYPTTVIPKPAVTLKWARSKDGSYFLVLSTKAEGLGKPELMGHELRVWEPSIRQFIHPTSIYEAKFVLPPYEFVYPGSPLTAPVPPVLIKTLREHTGIRRIDILFICPEIIEERKSICIADQNSALVEIECPASEY